MANTKPKAFGAAFNFVIVLFFVSTLAEDRIGNHQVCLQSESENWFTVYEICRSKGRQLLDPQRKKTQLTALHSKYYLADHHTWLAATHLGHKGKFVWATTGERANVVMRQNLTIDDRYPCVVLRNDTKKIDNSPCIRDYYLFCEESSICPVPALTFNGTYEEV